MFRLMITLVAAVLLLATPAPGLAQTKVTLPDMILDRLRVLTDATGTCQDGAFLPLGSSRFADLGFNRLLILLEVSDYMCTTSNTVVPLVVDSESHTVKLGEEMEGAVTMAFRGPAGAYWLATQTQIEASAPFLYRSVDGLVWQTVPLPENPDGDWSPFLFLTGLCFEGGEIRILLNDQAADPDPKYFTFSKPLDHWADEEWRLVADHGSVEPDPNICSPPGLPTGTWERTNYSMTDKILFKNREFQLIIPGNIENNGN